MAQPKPPIHMGRGIQHARELRNWTQEGLAEKLGPEWNQKRISTLEKRQTVDEPILQKVAEILGVEPAVLRNYEPQAALTVNNSFHDHAVANGVTNGTDFTNTNIVHDIKEIVATFQKQMEGAMTMYEQQTEEIKALYERLLEERDKE